MQVECDAIVCDKTARAGETRFCVGQMMKSRVKGHMTRRVFCGTRLGRGDFQCSFSPPHFFELLEIQCPFSTVL